MNVGAARRRGQPLRVLAVLLIAWIGARAMTWESPFRPLEPVLDQLSQSIRASETPPAIAPPPQAALRVEHGPVLPSSHARDEWFRAPPELQPLPRPFAVIAQPAPPAGEVMASHQILWLAATAHLPVPADVAALLRASAALGTKRPAPITAEPARDRWSFESWLLLRQGDSGAAVPGAALPSYGASQAGAIVRFRLAPGSGHRPAAYVRATQALASGKESELAVGAALRPMPAVPVSLYSEVRATRYGSGKVELRPAAFAVTEIPPIRLPHGLRGAAYAQAGYVGGRFATAFLDGQARIDREAGRFDLATARAGAGVWGGAQKGAARLDIGPTASLDLEVGDAPARLAIDYRVRVAGEAEPRSGIAVTLSTGF